MARIRSFALPVILARVYSVLVFAWAILHFAFGDRWAWLFLVSSFTPYLFAPLPAIFFIALIARRREVWLELIALLALAAFFYGAFFLPKPASINSSVLPLKVMTYNVMDWSRANNFVVPTIRASGADVIAIQELNVATADLVQRELIREYPYQVLDAKNDTRGMGIISRLPMRATGDTLSGNGIGVTQIVTVAWAGKSILAMNIHPMPTNFSPQDFLLDSEYVDWSIRERERDLQTVANFAATQKVPIIVLGDFNTSDQSDAYHAIANVMTDAWREKGWGLGHTFPAPDSQGNSRIVISGLALPTWLVRIDFVFHSRQWQTVSAQLGPWDGFSDHRPVIAELTLNEFLVK